MIVFLLEVFYCPRHKVLIKNVHGGSLKVGFSKKCLIELNFVGEYRQNMRNLKNMIKKPFFKPSCLVFEKSEHKLTLSDRNYRCILDCKQKCTENEPQINKERMERNFSYLATKFKTKENSYNSLYRKMLVDFLPVLILQANDEAEYQEELLERTTEVINQEVKSKNKIKNSDIETFKESYAKRKSAHNVLILFAYLIAVIDIFSKKELEKELGKTLALITKHVYLSDKGKIENIELEKWGWYILNFIDKNEDNYLFNLKEKGVKILNEKENFCNLKPLEAIEYFNSQGIEIAISDYKINYFYNLLTKVQKLTELLMQADVKNIPIALSELFEEFGKNPQVELATSLSITEGK